MTCREFIDFLADYLSGELPATQQAVFEEHLAICPDCVNYLDTYRETIRLGKAAFADPEDPVPEEVPEELVQAILSAVRKPTA
jgi:anti-sigma factor RsiW